MWNTVYIILGSSWTGKDTLIQSLLSTWYFLQLTSDTSREMRKWEKEWREYYFKKREDIEKWLQEWKYFQKLEFNNTLYAYTKEELLNKIQKKDVCLISHPKATELITFFLDQQNIKWKTIYLDLDEKVARERMLIRWDSLDSIKERENEIGEFIWYKKYSDYIISANQSKEKVFSDFLKVFEVEEKSKSCSKCKFEMNLFYDIDRDESNNEETYRINGHRECAFKWDNIKFNSNNWNCETMNLLREEWERVWYYNRDDSQNWSILVIPLNEDNKFQRGYIILTMYKDRGSVSSAKVMNDDWEEELLYNTVLDFCIQSIIRSI